MKCCSPAPPLNSCFVRVRSDVFSISERKLASSFVATLYSELKLGLCWCDDTVVTGVICSTNLLSIVQIMPVFRENGKYLVSNFQDYGGDGRIQEITMMQLLSVPTNSMAQPLVVKEESGDVSEYDFEVEFDALEADLVPITATLGGVDKARGEEREDDNGDLVDVKIDVEGKPEVGLRELSVSDVPADEVTAQMEASAGGNGGVHISAYMRDMPQWEAYEARVEQILQEQGALSDKDSGAALSEMVPKLDSVPALNVFAREISGEVSAGLINKEAVATSAVQDMAIMAKGHGDHRASTDGRSVQHQRLDFFGELGSNDDLDLFTPVTKITVKPALPMPESGGVKALLPGDMLVVNLEGETVEGHQKTMDAEANTLVRVFHVETARPMHQRATLSAAQSSTLVRDVVHLLSVDRGKEIEIQLMPEELGRLKFRIVPSDGQLVIHVSADRSDTLDSLRRNIGTFAQDLRDAGFESASFEFGDSGFEQREAETQDYEPVAGADSDVVEQPVGAQLQHALISPSDRLNIKL